MSLKNIQRIKQLKDFLSNLKHDTLKTSPLRVYLVHNPGAEAENYAIHFDLSELQGQLGGFVKPTLSVIAGRDDFDRTQFATNLRSEFTDYYNAQKKQNEHTDSDPFGGFITFVEALILIVATGGLALVPMMYLWIATATTEAFLNWIDSIKQKLPSLLVGKKTLSLSDQQKDIDHALSRIEVHPHPDLMMNALGQNRIENDPILRDTFEKCSDAWPLPDFVLRTVRFTRAAPGDPK